MYVQANPSARVKPKTLVNAQMHRDGADIPTKALLVLVGENINHRQCLLFGERWPDNKAGRASSLAGG